MIKSVTLKDFRGLDELKVPLSSATMLTGINGVGKTSVLEGLFCLFSQSRLDVSPLSRYNKSIGFRLNQAANIPFGFAVQQNYNYKLFWNECPSYGKIECSVDAVSDNGLFWSWKYKKAKLSDLDEQITINNPIPVDALTDFALWEWRTRGKVFKAHHAQDMSEKFRRAQVLTQDGGLYLLPMSVSATSMNICQYLDFASIRIQPQKLSFQTAKQLTKALQIIDSRITDVRLKDMVDGLSVIIDDNKEVSLGTIGNGAVTWASALIAIFDVAEIIKQQQTDIPILILIDEMGAGIHYSVMLDVWKFLSEFVRQNRNVQFVFTSHNDDCIRAFCEAFSNQDSAAVVRLHQTSVGKKVMPTEYKKESFRNIIDGKWEVRG